MTDLLISALISILGVTLAAHLLSALLAAWRYRRRPAAPKDETTLPYISLVRPVCGLARLGVRRTSVAAVRSVGRIFGAGKLILRVEERLLEG